MPSFQVRARDNSVSGGVGLNTGIGVQPGQRLRISANANDTWRLGGGNRVCNANGLGNPLGGNFGFHTRGPQSFLFGALVGSLDGGRTFFGVGTQLVMTILTSGTLTLYCWDSNNADNAESIQVNVTI